MTKDFDSTCDYECMGGSCRADVCKGRKGYKGPSKPATEAVSAEFTGSIAKPRVTQKCRTMVADELSGALGCGWEMTEDMQAQLFELIDRLRAGKQ